MGTKTTPYTLHWNIALLGGMFDVQNVPLHSNLLSYFWFERMWSILTNGNYLRKWTWGKLPQEIRLDAYTRLDSLLPLCNTSFVCFFGENLPQNQNFIFLTFDVEFEFEFVHFKNELKNAHSKEPGILGCFIPHAQHPTWPGEGTAAWLEGEARCSSPCSVANTLWRSTRGPFAL